MMKPLDSLDVMPFGKYKGELIGSIIEKDPKYVDWLLKTVDYFDLNEQTIQYLKEHL